MVEYVIEGRIAVIIGCSVDETEIVIPEYIENVPVGKIEDNSFNENEKLRRIVFPKTVKLIGRYAFAGCKNLKEIVFSEGLEMIEDWAFISCDVEHVKLPDSLKSIGKNAFLGNPVRFEIEEFIKNKKDKKKTTFTGKRNTAAFPIELMDAIEGITDDIIKDTATYHYSFLEALEFEEIDEKFVDIPYVFDGNEFMVACFTKMALQEPRIVLTPDSKSKIGQYEDDDPDFLILRANIFSGDESLGEFVFKTPYLEDIELKVLELLTIEDKGYTYYLRVAANLGCYGTSNPNREFAFDLFKHIQGKFQTQVDNNLLSIDLLNEINSQVDELSIDALKSFLKQVSGAPVLEYMMAVFELLLSDEEIESQDEIINFLSEELDTIYNTMGTFQSFCTVAFDMKRMTKFLSDVLGFSLDDIRKRYDLTVVDSEGTPLTIEAIAAYRKAFFSEEYNYTLYADYLNYMYRIMDKINQEYALKTYQE